MYRRDCNRTFRYALKAPPPPISLPHNQPGLVAAMCSRRHARLDCAGVTVAVAVAAGSLLVDAVAAEGAGTSHAYRAGGCCRESADPVALDGAAEDAPLLGKAAASLRK